VVEQCLSVTPCYLSGACNISYESLHFWTSYWYRKSGPLNSWDSYLLKCMQLAHACPSMTCIHLVCTDALMSCIDWDGLLSENCRTLSVLSDSRLLLPSPTQAKEVWCVDLCCIGPRAIVKAFRFLTHLLSIYMYVTHPCTCTYAHTRPPSSIPKCPSLPSNVRRPSLTSQRKSGHLHTSHQHQHPHNPHYYHAKATVPY